MVDQSVTDLQTEVAEDVAEMRRAAETIKGFPAKAQAMVDAAVAAALAAGVSPEVQAILTGLKTDLDAAQNELTAANPQS